MTWHVRAGLYLIINYTVLTEKKDYLRASLSLFLLGNAFYRKLNQLIKFTYKYKYTLYTYFSHCSVFGVLFIFIWILVDQLFIRQGGQVDVKTTETGSSGGTWEGSLTSLKVNIY